MTYFFSLYHLFYHLWSTKNRQFKNCKLSSKINYFYFTCLNQLRCFFSPPYLYCAWPVHFLVGLAHQKRLVWQHPSALYLGHPENTIIRNVFIHKYEGFIKNVFSCRMCQLAYITFSFTKKQQFSVNKEDGYKLQTWSKTKHTIMKQLTLLIEDASKCFPQSL